MTSTEQAVADYLARGNKVTRCATNDSNGITARAWSSMVRGDTAPRDEPRAYVAAIDHLDREHLVNSQGEYLGIA